MIELIDVGKYYVTEFGKHYVFRNVSLLLPPDRSVGVMGPNGAGKSTFLRLIGGADIPSEGSILRSGRISPPMGLTPGLQNSLTAAENARFAGRIYGLDRDEIADMIEYVRETANIGKFFDQPVYMYSAGMKQRVAFAINMSMSFDYYLFDEIGAAGDKEFRKMAREMVFERLRTSKFVMTSHSVRDLLEFCESGIVIRDGDLTYFEDINDAVAFYGDSDEGDDDSFVKKMERRKAREERRRLKAEGGQPPLLELSANDSMAEPAAGPEVSAEERRRRRAERQRRHKDGAAETPVSAEMAEDLRHPQSALPNGEDAELADVPRLEAPAVGTPPATTMASGEEPAEADERAARLSEIREKRRQRREERQRLAADRGEADETSVTPEASKAAAIETPAEPEAEAITPPDTGSEDAIEMDRAARRAAAEERRRQRREERLRLVAENGAEPESSGTSELADVAAILPTASAEAGAINPADPVAADAIGLDRAARRAAAEERRRQRREERQRELEEGKAESEGSPAAETAETVERVSPAASPFAMAAGDNGMDTANAADRAARRASAEDRRRRRREERAQAADPVAAVKSDEPKATPVEQAEEGIRPARRGATAERRRRRETAAEDEMAESGMSAVAGLSAEPADVRADQPEASKARADASSATRRTGADAEALRQHMDKAPVAMVADACPQPESLFSDADRRILLLRLSMRQDRAQAKASRAARLLLQHLEAPESEPHSSRQGRAMLVKAAQDIAAAEAAAARALLESALEPAAFSAIDTSPTKLGRPAG